MNKFRYVIISQQQKLDVSFSSVCSVIVMAIPAHFSKPDHLAELSNKSRLFRPPNDSSFSAASSFIIQSNLAVCLV